MAPAPRRFSDRFAGAVLGLAAVLSLVLILHHPVLGHVSSPEATTAAIRKLAALDRWVHGGLIALMALTLLGLLHLSQRLGLDKPAVAGGFVAYALGTVLVSIAGVFDGFVISDLGEHCAAAGVDAAACSATALDLLRLCGTVVQDFTKVGLGAMSLGVAFWGVAFLHRRDPRGVAGLGMGLSSLAAGLAPAAMMIFAPFRFTPHTLLVTFAGLALWMLSVAAFLIFARRPAVEEASHAM
ncbi:MAG TPA: hypothetical protein VG407_07610 [Caulobacteraceae bacterium]|jgi:hypothetical protein|nr:hypothetical protein [Caulobacteraceae bacterium]